MYRNADMTPLLSIDLKRRWWLRWVFDSERLTLWHLSGVDNPFAYTLGVQFVSWRWIACPAASAWQLRKVVAAAFLDAEIQRHSE